MKRFIPLILLVALWPAQVFACRCVEPDPRAAYSNTDTVAIVEIYDVAVLPDDIKRAEGKVLKAWKANLPDSLSIFTGENCRYDFRKGTTYLLYLKRSPQGEYGTYRCRGNLPYVEAATRLKWLEQHGKPADTRVK